MVMGQQSQSQSQAKNGGTGWCVQRVVASCLMVSGTKWSESEAGGFDLSGSSARERNRDGLS